MPINTFLVPNVQIFVFPFNEKKQNPQIWSEWLAINSSQNY